MRVGDFSWYEGQPRETFGRTAFYRDRKTYHGYETLTESVVSPWGQLLATYPWLDDQIGN